MDPKVKITELMEFADVLNCQIVILNYRGFAYSQSAPVTEQGVEIDA